MEDLITFDAKSIYWGIVYHLHQSHQNHWRLYDQITPDSIVAMYTRLVTEDKSFKVRRWTWQRLTDQQRFDFLMFNSGTEITAILPVNTEEPTVGELSATKVQKRLPSNKSSGS